MLVIHKFKLSACIVNTLLLRVADEVLSFGLDVSGDFCIWVRRDPERVVRAKRMFDLVCTDSHMPDDAIYVGTVVVGKHEWHCFEVKE